MVTLIIALQKGNKVDSKREMTATFSDLQSANHNTFQRGASRVKFKGEKGGARNQDMDQFLKKGRRIDPQNSSFHSLRKEGELEQLLKTEQKKDGAHSSHVPFIEVVLHILHRSKSEALISFSTDAFHVCLKRQSKRRYWPDPNLLLGGS